MLAEAINRIVELANNSFKAELLKPTAEPSHVYYLSRKDSCDRMEADPQPRTHTADSIDTIIAFAERFAGDGQVSVWYNRDGVAALLNDYTRRDRVSLALKPTPEIQALAALKITTGYQQPEFLRLLRIGLRRVLGQSAEQLIATVKNMKFISEETGSREIQQTKSSVGRTIMNEFTGAGSMPEEIDTYVRVWEGMPQILGCSIKLALEVDPAQRSFSIVPLPGQIERAWQEAEEELGKELRRRLESTPNVAIYFGRP